MSGRVPRVAGAPISWGVCEVPGWGYQLEPDRVLSEMAGLGLPATELGPQGYLPTDAPGLEAALTDHGLTLAAGFVPAILHEPARLQEELERVGDQADLLAAAGADVLVLAAGTGRDGYESGADLDAGQRGWGTALETAERTGHNDFAALLRDAGARSSGRSVGDTVCVRPWKAEGYCGTVESVEKTAYRIRIRKIVGCTGGCVGKAECSGGRRVGGRGGLKVGDEVATVSWCLTHTGVLP